MMGPDFFQTGMGRKHYEHDIPELIKAVNRLAEAIEKNNILSTEKQDKNETAAKI